MIRHVILPMVTLYAACSILLPGAPAGCAGPAWGGSDRILVAPAGIKLRQGPDAFSAIILTIPNGAKVSVLEEGDREVEIDGVRGRWSRVGYDRVIGWVFAGRFAEPDGLTLKDIAGRSYFFSPDDIDDSSTTGFALESDGSFTAECLLRGNGTAKIEGIYTATFKDGAASLLIQGTAEGRYVSGKEKRVSTTFTDGTVIIWKKDGTLRGTFLLPLCSPLKGKRLE